MKSNTRYEHVAAFSKARMKAFLKYGFVIICGLLLAWQQSSASEESHTPATTLSQDFALITPSLSLSSLAAPFDQPFESAPVPNEQGIPDELDTDEDTDHEGHSLAELHAAQYLFQIASQGNHFIPASRSVQTLTAVPYFILYHSWKSFLS